MALKEVRQSIDFQATVVARGDSRDADGVILGIF